MSELVTMYPAQANSPETSLSGALTAAGTTVNVVDGSVLPEAPNLLTIGADGSTAETVLMPTTGKNITTALFVTGLSYQHSVREMLLHLLSAQLSEEQTEISANPLCMHL